MKSILFFTVVIAGFFGIIAAMAKPEMVTKEYENLKAPINKYFAEKNREIWAKEKNREYVDWVLKLRLPPDCITPNSALRDLECKTARERHFEQFEVVWANKVRSGWKPEGAD